MSRYTVTGLAEMSSRWFQVTVEADTKDEAFDKAHNVVVNLPQDDEAWAGPITDLAVTDIEPRDCVKED